MAVARLRRRGTAHTKGIPQVSVKRFCSAPVSSVQIAAKDTHMFESICPAAGCQRKAAVERDDARNVRLTFVLACCPSVFGVCSFNPQPPLAASL